MDLLERTRRKVLSASQFICRDVDLMTSPPTRRTRMGSQRYRSEADAETHPSFTTALGPEAGDIYFRVKVTAAHPRVSVCAYRMKDAFTAVEFKIDLDVDDEMMKAYQPRPSLRQWPDREQQNVHCVSLKDIPPGQHVIGIEAKVKKITGVTHIITWE